MCVRTFYYDLKWRMRVLTGHRPVVNYLYDPLSFVEDYWFPIGYPGRLK